MIRMRLQRSRLILAAVLAVAAACAVSAGPADAARAASAPPSAAPAAGAGPLSVEQAAAKARAEGRDVIASALTSPTSLTTVSPAGTATVTETLQPTRAWRGGTWHALDASLSRGQHGTVAPAVTANGLTLSGGGSSLPLAVMNNHGRTLSLSWPTPLPAPTLSGSTATYANVLPGVNLAVTVTLQGGMSEVLIVTSAAAAADPALTSLVLRASAPGLHITATDGMLRVAATANGQPAFTAPAPAMWDSTRPPAGTKTVKGADGTILVSPSGDPAYASAAGPGAGSRYSLVPVSVTDSMIALSPPQASLTGRGVKYPVFIDPSFEPDPVSAGADNWTQVDSTAPNTSYWDETQDLRIGLCDWTTGPGGPCNDGIANRTYYARSMFTMPVPAQITAATYVDSANLYMTNSWSSTCVAERVQLWRTGPISSSTTFSNQPSWNTYNHVDFSNGCPGQSYVKDNVAWNVLGGVNGAKNSGQTTMTFGLRAAVETTSDVGWKRFLSGSGNLTLTVSYHNPPNTPASLSSSPGGACQTTMATQAPIGNNGVTLFATVGDVDNTNGDQTLNTTFTVYNASTQAAETPAIPAVQSGNVAGGVTVSTPVSLQTLQQWGGTNTPASYYWTASTSDIGNPILSSQTAGPCYFQYNPLGPSSVGWSLSPSSAPVGSSVTATFTAPTGCSPTTNPCPTSFTYQVGVAAPVTVNADSNNSWTGPIPVTQTGPIQLTVYGSAGGNPGALEPPAQTPIITGNPPATPYPDGYFTGGSYPSLLTTGTGSSQSLWLSPGTGNGTVSPPIDIGSLGTGINPGTDGPADWNGAQVLHGSFAGAGHGVQDVMAYFPATGTAVIIAGSGAVAPLQPSSIPAIPAGTAFADPALTSNPTTLVAAGNASELGATYSDVIGIIGGNLDLFSTSAAGNCTGVNNVGGYGYCQLLSGQAPNSSDTNWADYTLATMEMPDATHTAGNPADIALLALNTKNGTLYETTNPNWSSSTLASTTPVGSGSWTQLGVPWGTTPPSLISADTNNGGTGVGSTELWTLSGTTLTPYLVSGAGLTAENAGTAISYPAHSWPLSDGIGNPTATVATDTIAGQNAALSSSGATWSSDDYFGGDIQLNGSGALATTGPAVTTASYTVSAWVNVPTLPAWNWGVVGQDGTNVSGFCLGYWVGAGWTFRFANTDTTNPGFTYIMGPVAQPGTWTNLVGVYDSATHTAQFYVNGTLAGTASYTPSWTATGALSIGRDLYNAAGSDYLTGSIADVQTWNTPLTAAQVSALSSSPAAFGVLSNLVPAIGNANDGSSHELGMKFESTSSGQITAIRYYRAPSETGSHTGHLWSSSGTLLASATFTNETGSGWQQATLSVPVTIQASTVYVVSVGINTYYVGTNYAFTNPVTDGPLSSVADGANGVFGNLGSFPRSSYENTNYFVDVGFLPAG